MAAVADDFWNIYSKEWQEANQSLRSEKHDEEIIYLLMQIVRGVYDFCVNETKNSHHKKTTEELTESYLHHKLPPSLHRDHVTNPVRSFVHRCVGCLHQMCLLKHSPLYIYWIPKGEVIDKQKFDIKGDKDEHVCDWTVWPAVIHTDGTVLKKGVVIPV
ncbi:uncharacterized protein LOC123556219 [Mercenaria mercenaria]|uniref:uncharacterized protein LOC123556219 n=1 Tax=Mercenaria mercenaria TaxID=6596 RepID=UPI00234E396D|nr:uncharacterized protein LOC123556219 [Mercenaria mercenaria]XP_045202743.2 uncharacterized protein LOC123556219 [Mercenaria mercenaria]XP_045202744.2 uncharacterized protein LOC123556219 [Mercenaria mercenaria]XP_053398479.1 uncharacterized protein LOC123556219 [Mercenaria mercenaria]XP_053398480.1 uncharacterized protein LOC123556219 [Mercenaria mercenaria]